MRWSFPMKESNSIVLTVVSRRALIGSVVLRASAVIGIPRDGIGLTEVTQSLWRGSVLLGTVKLLCKLDNKVFKHDEDIDDDDSGADLPGSNSASNVLGPAIDIMTVSSLHSRSTVPMHTNGSLVTGGQFDDLGAIGSFSLSGPILGTNITYSLTHSLPPSLAHPLPPLPSHSLPPSSDVTGRQFCTVTHLNAVYFVFITNCAMIYCIRLCFQIKLMQNLFVYFMHNTLTQILTLTLTSDKQPRDERTLSSLDSGNAASTSMATGFGSSGLSSGLYSPPEKKTAKKGNARNTRNKKEKERKIALERSGYSTESPGGRSMVSGSMSLGLRGSAAIEEEDEDEGR